MEINGTPPKSYFNMISLHLLKYDFYIKCKYSSQKYLKNVVE